MTNTIHVTIFSAWLPLMNIPYTIEEGEPCPCRDMVHIEIECTEAAALIELGRRLEQNKSQLKAA